MMELITSIVGGILSGGATGLIGIALQRFFDFKAKQLELQVVKLNHENALALAGMETDRARIRAEADRDIADRGAQARELEAQEDARARENEAASRSLLASYQHDRAAYLDPEAQKRKGKVGAVLVVLMALVDFARGILRPGLTVHLTVIVTLMFSQMLILLKLQGHEWSTGELVPLVKMIISSILYCWTTCVVWWFGTRSPQPAR
jgi:hypothetical protein